MVSQEINRIRRVYKERTANLAERRRWSYFNPANLFTVQTREREIINLLVTHGINDLSRMRILDVGCGNGGMLRDFVKYGANPNNLFGIDLIEEPIKEGKRITPQSFSSKRQC